MELLSNRFPLTLMEENQIIELAKLQAECQHSGMKEKLAAVFRRIQNIQMDDKI